MLILNYRTSTLRLLSIMACSITLMACDSETILIELPNTQEELGSTQAEVEPSAEPVVPPVASDPDADNSPDVEEPLTPATPTEPESESESESETTDPEPESESETTDPETETEPTDPEPETTDLDPEPAPTTPTSTTADNDFCPAYIDSGLYRTRSNTLVIGPEQENWEELISQASADTEILLQDGEYLMDTETLYLNEPNITIRSFSGNPDAVVIQGMGIYTGASEGFVIAADNITITELSMHSMRRHAIFMKPASNYNGELRDTYVYNMDIYNTGTQQVKGSDGGKNYNAVIACNTIGHTQPAVGDYIGGIGIFEGIDVIVRDNYIYNITGDGTGCDVASPTTACNYETPPAIYMRASTDSIVERNTIIDSFRGISLGLVEGHVRGIIRNNFIYRSGPGDMGISVENSINTIVEHNTVMVEGYWAPIEVRYGSGGHVFRNNLTNLPINLRGTSGSLIEGNIEYATVDDFIAPGNVHLSANSLAIGAGLTPSTVTSDIDGDTRAEQWDVGADQYNQ